MDHNSRRLPALGQVSVWPLMDAAIAQRKPVVSVIICCFTDQRMNDIFDAVNSVRRQVPPPGEVILAVDNNRSLYEQLLAKSPQSVCVILHEGICGLSATRNAGVASAKGDLVAFLDDDAVAQPGWLNRLAVLFEDPEVVAVGGRAILDWAEGRPFWFPEELDWAVGGTLSWFPAKRAPVRNPHGFSMCFRRSVFDTSGGFATEIGNVKERPRGGEEADLCLRIAHRLPTAKILFEPEAIVVHKVTASKARFSLVLRRAFNEGFDKSWIQRTAPGLSRSRALSTERAYVQHLLHRALPSRLMSLGTPTCLVQVVTIILCMFAAGLGYVIGKFGVARPIQETS